MNGKKAIGILGGFILIGTMIMIGDYHAFINLPSVVFLVLLVILTYIAKYKTFKFKALFFDHAAKVIVPIGALITSIGLVHAMTLAQNNLLNAIAVSLLALIYSLIIKIFL